MVECNCTVARGMLPIRGGCRIDATGCRTRPLDCRVGALPLLAMTGRGVVGGVVSSQFRDSSTPRCHCEPVRARQSSLMRCEGCPDDAGVADGSAGLPRQADAFLAMTKVGRVRRSGTLPVFGRVPPRCHCEPVKGVAIQSGSLCGMPGRCGGCRTRPLDCRVGALPLLAMTTGTGIGEGVGDLQSDANGRIVKQQRTTEHE